MIRIKGFFNLRFWKTALALALPIAFQNLLTSCASLVDTAMIVPLGDVAVSAVGVGGRFTFMLNVISFGFASGSSTLISQYWGVGDKSGIRKTYGVGFVGAMSFTAIFTSLLLIFPSSAVSLFGPEANVAELATSYLSIVAIAFPFIMYSQISSAALRATEKVTAPLISSFASVTVNTFLNYCLIGGHLGFPSLGVKGAAIATVIGCAVQAVIVFIFMNFGKNAVKAPIKEYFSVSREFIEKYIKTVTPVLLNESLWSIGTNVYVMVLARLGTEQYAGYSIFETIQQLFYVFFVGICSSAAIIIGKSVGKNEREESYSIAKRFIIATPVLGVILGGILIPLRYPLLSLFDIETVLARDTAADLLLIYALWVGVRMIPYTMICGVFRSGGDTKTAAILEVSVMYSLGIPLTLLAGLVIKIPFVWVVFVMYAAEDAAKTLLCFIRFFSKKWIIVLTDNKKEEANVNKKTAQ